MNEQQAMSLLRQVFPEFEDRSVENVQLCARTVSHSVDVYDFACFVAKLHQQIDAARLHSVFNLMEEFLAAGSAEVRDWVCGWVEALQNVASWRRYGSAPFDQFLGPGTRMIWNRFEAIERASFELDLAGCSVFEAEVLTWRFAREKARGLTAA
jgi:hypothetical protein